MAKTKIEVITAALRHLGVVSAGEAAQAEDIAHAGGVLDGLMSEMLIAQELELPDVDAMTDEYLIPLYRLLASEIAPHFSLPSESRSAAIARLRQVAADSYIEEPVQATYF